MASSHREAVIQASATISRLREVIAKANAELLQTEKQLDELLSNAPVTGENSMPLISSPAQGSIAAAHFGERAADLSLNRRIIDLMVVSNHRDFSAEEVAAELKYLGLPSIRSALARLADGNKIVRTERGRYRCHTPDEIAEAS